jgi:hypothetical protein
VLLFSKCLPSFFLFFLVIPCGWSLLGIMRKN